MQQLSLSRPLSPTRILALPDRPRAARIAPIGTKVAANLTPGVSPRKRLALPLRPVQTLTPRPAQAQPIVRGRELPGGVIAFVSAEQAWFWTLAVLAARHGRVLPKRRRPRSLAPTKPEPEQGPEPRDELELELAPRHDSMAPLIFRRDPVEYHHVKIPRPCDPDDIIRAINQLHQRDEITLAHARVLRRHGDSGRAPDPANPNHAKDVALWTEALTRLEVLLREKSIVATE